MPVYSDSVIVSAFSSSENILNQYGHRAVFVTETSRPSRLRDVWVVAPQNADVLFRYRGEYKLGIISGGSILNRGYRIGSEESTLTCLTGPLTKIQSGACKVLALTRNCVPILERSMFGDIPQCADINIILASTPIPSENKSRIDPSLLVSEEKFVLSTEDLTALSTFEPYRDLYRRFCIALLSFYGISYVSGTLNISEIGRFLKHIAPLGVKSLQAVPLPVADLETTAHWRITYLLKQLQLLGLETESFALQTFLQEVVSKYQVPEIFSTLWIPRPLKDTSEAF